MHMTDFQSRFPIAGNEVLSVNVGYKEGHMNNYKELAISYLKMNKKRSMVTVLGVTVAVTVLYTILNLGWSALLDYRETVREEQDYEIVLLTETESQIEQIMADEQVKSASVGQYFGGDYYEPKIYNNALYVNTTNPYCMEKILEKLENTYGVEGALNAELAGTYLQGDDGNWIFISIVLVLLISFIFAIFGVGIVRNSIQLSTLEQIKDYGNLRCVGASKGQLKTIIYIEGAVLELTGNVTGVLAGAVASMMIGHFLKWNTGFHFVPIVPILIAFLGDLYFAMKENCKVIVNMTPVSAIRGEYRIRKEKIKVRKQSIFGRLFGIEGDYAYKSIMRNPGRFHKTVWALGVGIAAFIAVAGSVSTLRNVYELEKNQFKYYNVYFKKLDNIDMSEESILPPTSLLKSISDMEGVTAAKRIYSSNVFLADYEAYYKHFTEDYLTQTAAGVEKTVIREADTDLGLYQSSAVMCYGYDEEDYKRYQSVLTDGTLDVSENGLVLVNGGNVAKNTDDAFRMEYMDVEYTNYKVGDTIDIIDIEKFRAMVNEKLEILEEEYEVEKEKLADEDHTEGENKEDDSYEAYQEQNQGNTPEEKLEDEFAKKKQEAEFECFEQLRKEGAYKTYTIEGIVSEDVNWGGAQTERFILPLDRYYQFTGTDESVVSGMQYHFEKFYAGDYDKINMVSKESFNCYNSLYPELMRLFDKMKYLNYGVMAFIVFIVLMSTLNIINTTASNLHLRRKEFAQLRVIGISRKRLMKTVILEGVISAIIANVIGIILGVIIIAGNLGNTIYLIFGLKYQFPYIAAITSIIVSTLILIGSIYVPLRGLKQDLAADLATGGD